MSLLKSLSSIQVWNWGSSKQAEKEMERKTWTHLKLKVFYKTEKRSVLARIYNHVNIDTNKGHTKYDTLQNIFTHSVLMRHCFTFVERLTSHLENICWLSKYVFLIFFIWFRHCSCYEAAISKKLSLDKVGRL